MDADPQTATPCENCDSSGRCTYQCENWRNDPLENTPPVRRERPTETAEGLWVVAWVGGHQIQWSVLPFDGASDLFKRVQYLRNKRMSGPFKTWDEACADARGSFSNEL